MGEGTSRRRSWWRPAVGVGLVPALLASAPAATAQVGGPDAGDPAPPATRVELTALTTETTQVFAEPDGTRTAVLHPQPVRVQRDGGWVDVDTTLVAGPDGRVAPAAVPVTMSFAGGGDDPLVRLGVGDSEAAVRWPGDLPAPVLDGDTATYPEVRPGVDLRVTALVTGYTTRLVLKDRPAVAAADEIAFGLSTSGRAVATEEYDHGSLAVDGDGHAFLHTWPEQVAESAGELTVAAEAVGSTPDEAYPVLLEPLAGQGIPVTLQRNGWARVKSGKPTTRYWNSGTVAKAGNCGTWAGCNGIDRVRSYFQFRIPAVLRGLRSQDILGASFSISMTHSANCVRQDHGEVVAHQVEPMSHPGPSWPGPTGIGPNLGHTGATHGRNCGGPQRVGFGGAGPAIVRTLQRGDAAVNLRLRIGLVPAQRGEFNQHAWRTFNADSARLTVNYNTRPRAPRNLSVDGMGCTGAGDPQYTTSRTDLLLRGTVADPDGGQLRARFEWRAVDAAGNPGPRRGDRLTGRQGSGTSFTAFLGRDTFGDGERFAYRVRGVDDHTEGPWSSYCHLVVDRTPPDRPPEVSSEHYPEGNQRHGSPGQTGLFTFHANGVADVAGFRYGLDTGDSAEPTLFVPAGPQRDGTQRATVRLTPLQAVDHTLAVVSVDRAGNSSSNQDGGGSRAYRFAVDQPSGSVGHWPLAGRGADPVAADDSGHGHPATVHGLGSGAAWVAGRAGDALRFDGTGGYARTNATNPGGPQRIVHTDQSFAVAAWVRVDGGVTGGWRTAVSQASDRSGSFFLQYHGDSGEIAFGMPRTPTGTAIDRAAAPLPATGTWVHVAGVYVWNNPDNHHLELYLNGRLASTQARTAAAWHQDGPLQLGRGKWNGSWGQPWIGEVDDVRLFSRALQVEDLRGHADPTFRFHRGLANGPLTREASYPLNDGDGDLGRDGSGNQQTMALTGGATWRAEAGVDGGTVLALDGAGAHASALDPAVRTDGSFTVTAWVRPELLDVTHRVAVSQDGQHHSGFMLGYDHGRCTDGSPLPCDPGAQGVWAFSVPAGDRLPLRGITVTGGRPAGGDLGQWVHLAGVLDVPAGQLRLYVNGGPPRVLDLTGADLTRWHAAGGLQIGRAKRNGEAVDFFAGEIAGVELHAGVKTNAEILHEALICRCPEVHEPTVHTGTFGRWHSHTGDQLSTVTGRAPRGYHFERALGRPAPADAAEPTRMLYGCALTQHPGNGFTSADPDCEGELRTGALGPVYERPPDGIPSVPLHRCRVDDPGQPEHGHRFDAADPGCGGHVEEFRLGYLAAYAPLVRYVYPGAHRSSTGGVPPRYRPEGVLGLLSTIDGPDRMALYACATGTGTFSSLDPGCEGTGRTGVPLGYSWTVEPEEPGAVGRMLYRCRVGEDHFDSLDPDCEGRHRDGPLGYVVFRR